MSSPEAAAASRDAEVLHPVFVGTSIGTNLVLNVSDSDTASDFQKKLVLVHRELYPAIGDVEVKGLKVKEGGKVYDVVDSVSVKSLFEATRWFMSVDLEQTDGTQVPSKGKAGDQLALKWVTHSRSIERHDDHESLNTRSKIVPFESQKALNASQLTSGDSYKDISKNVEEDVAGNEKQLDNEPQKKLDTVNADTSFKKRSRYVGNESSPTNDCWSGLPVKKKRPTRVKSHVQASEENIGLTHDDGKVDDKGAGMNNEDFFEHKSKGKSETEKDGELVQKPDTENEKVYALINAGSNGEERASDQIDTRKDDLESALEQRPEAKLPGRKKGTTVRENTNEGKKGKGRKAAVKKKDDSLLKHTDDLATVHASVIDESKTNEVSENTLGDANKGDDVTVKDVEISVENMEGKSGKEFTNTNDVATQTNVEILLPRLKGLMNNGKRNEEMDDKEKPKTKRKSRKSAAGNNYELIKKPVNGNVCEDVNTLGGDVSSTVLASVIDERTTSKVSENTLKDANKAEDVIVKEVEITEENAEETSRKEFADANDHATVANEENLLPQSESLVNNDADSLEKQNEKADDLKKQKKKRKSRKSAGRNEDELITKHVDGEVSGDVVVKPVDNSVEKVEEKSGKNFKDANDVNPVMNEERRMNEVSGNTVKDANNVDDMIVKEVEIAEENAEERSRKEFADTNDAATVANEENLLPHSESVGNNVADSSKKQKEKADDSKKQKKKRKSRKSAEKNEIELITKHVDGDVSGDLVVKMVEGSVEKAEEKSGKVFRDANEVKTVMNEERMMNEVSENTLKDANKADGVIVKEVEITEENVEETSRKEFADTNDAATVANEENLLPHPENVVNNDADNLEKQNEKVDDTKKPKKKRKTRKSAGKNDDELITKHVNGDVSDDVVVKVVGKSVEKVEEKSGKELKDANDVKTVTDEETLLPNLEGTMNNDAAHLEKQNEKMDDTKKPEPRLKRKSRKAASRNEESITSSGADGNDGGKIKEKDAEIGHERLMEKTNKNIKSQDLPSKHQSTEVQLDKSQSVDHNHLPEEALKDATVSEVPKIDARKANRQQPILGQTRAKTMKKQSVNSSPQVKSLLNAPASIFGDDSDDDETDLSGAKIVRKRSMNSSLQVKKLSNVRALVFGDDSDSDESVNSGSSSSTRTPSPSSSSSSSSGSSFKGKVAGKKNITNQLSKLKNMSMADRLRNSSRFKKAKLTASSQVEDTESQPVDFVPESQL